MIPLVALSVLAGLPALDALVQDEARFRTDGATIRLVVEAPDGTGRLRGAILFDLDPGWKTYWIDPGEAGLAPTLRFTMSGTAVPATLRFPAPIRFEEGGAIANGYDEPLAIAFSIEASAAGTLGIELTAGLCLDLCVPVSIRLATDLSQEAPLGDLALVERAFLALPEDRGANAEAIGDGDDLLVQLPAGREGASDLFIEPSDGWSFAPARNEGSVWRVPVRSEPEKPAAGEPVFRAVIADGGRGEAIRIELP